MSTESIERWNEAKLAENEGVIGRDLEALVESVTTSITQYAAESLQTCVNPARELEIEDWVRDLIVNTLFEKEIHSIDRECESLGSEGAMWKSRLQQANELKRRAKQLRPISTSYDALQRMGV